MKRTRITLDYDTAPRETYEKIKQIICPARWGTGIDVFGFLNDNERRLFDLLIKGVIVIDECEYELPEMRPENELARYIKSYLGKRSNHPILQEMSALFGGEPFKVSGHYRNTLYFPNLKAFARADGMKPEDVAEMLSLTGCEKIILFPYFPLDGKSAYYELSLAVPKEQFVDFINHLEQKKAERLGEALLQAGKQNTTGGKVNLRLEKKSDWKTVEQVIYRAFRDAPPTDADDGREALLAKKIRSCPAFIPELDYVAELHGAVIGNIMYTHSKIVNDNGGEWETLTFGPLSVLPKYQRDGVGSALIRKTLDVARELGHRAILIYGHESYYPRFGFKPALEFGITTEDGKNFPAFMALPLNDGALDGVHGRLICDEVYTALDKEESDKLNAKLAEPMDVDEYISSQPEHIQEVLRTVRVMLKMTFKIDGAIEKISWGMPTYWKGQNLIHFAANKNHLGIYPGAAAMVHFAPRLTELKTSKGAIQFPYKDLIGEHLTLITEIASWCAEHNAR
jgi:predicted N-acetyltransferase YhbS/uncharacterized protein YdhG (YjbR/CyaY superfamily)